GGACLRPCLRPLIALSVDCPRAETSPAPTIILDPAPTIILGLMQNWGAHPLSINDTWCRKMLLHR
ncbi:MAG TPA: hypothetical protein VL485_20015, partial [Ktedonobacteraceae bacterium]|nr:hypothetical protein [Ktedonobacteraceae bacterium]